jgi:hypothetical protein
MSDRGVGHHKVGCFEGLLVIFLLIFVVFPYEMFKKAEEQAKTAIADKAVQSIDVVILTESQDEITRRLLAVTKPGPEHVAEFHGCRLYPVSQATLPEGYVKPAYLQVQDNGITVPVYAVLPSVESAQQWLTQHGYSDADFDFGTISSERLSTYVHRKHLGGNQFNRSELIVAAYSDNGAYYIYDYSVTPNDDMEGYKAFMKARSR